MVNSGCLNYFSWNVPITQSDLISVYQNDNTIKRYCVLKVKLYQLSAQVTELNWTELNHSRSVYFMIVLLIIWLHGSVCSTLCKWGAWTNQQQQCSFLLDVAADGEMAKQENHLHAPQVRRIRVGILDIFVVCNCVELCGDFNGALRYKLFILFVKNALYSHWK